MIDNQENWTALLTIKRRMSLPAAKSYWSNFHFRTRRRVMESAPGLPVNTVGVRCLLRMIKDAIQVGWQACVVPPSPLVELRTVSICRFVMVFVTCCELHSSVPSQRIPSSAWKKVLSWGSLSRMDFYYKQQNHIWLQRLDMKGKRLRHPIISKRENTFHRVNYSISIRQAGPT